MLKNGRPANDKFKERKLSILPKLKKTRIELRILLLLNCLNVNLEDLVDQEITFRSRENF